MTELEFFWALGKMGFTFKEAETARHLAVTFEYDLDYMIQKLRTDPTFESNVKILAGED